MNAVRGRRPRVRSYAMAVALGVALTLAMSGTAFATGTLDQSQTKSDWTDFLITPTSTTGVIFAQTFTDGITGNLDQVDLDIGQGVNCAADEPLQVSIETTSGGVPTNIVIATASLPQASVPFTPAWTSVQFAPAAPVTAGVQYAIVLTSEASKCADSGPPYEWQSDHSDLLSSYAGGQFVHSGGNDGASWLLDSWEATFKTYVENAPQLAAQLLSDVQNVGPSGSLAAKVRATQTALAAGNDAGACLALSQLVAEVKAQTGKSISPSVASALMSEAQRVRALLGC